ncbi:MAG: DUF1565 domain-containing protein [Leptolyngbyaceae cyanobacterium bins.302]|nr:DUF1565 domain-containing protein [Leptolyngbyaceae cyanobacterium bins.302]
MRWFIPVSVACLAIWSQPIAIAQLPAIPSPQTSDTITTTVIHVNPVSGNDTTADGSDRAPFKTITRALDAAVPNTTIQLAPGTYSTNTGESFPIALKPRVILQGNPETRGQEVIIRGGGAFSSPNLPQQNVAILGGANQSSLLGVTVTNPDGYAIQIESSNPTIAHNTLINNSRGGIVLTGSSASVIRSNFFYQNGTSSIRILGNAQPQIQENIIEQSDVGIMVGGTASPLIVGNRVTQNKTGIAVQGQAQPKLRGNSVEGNEQFGLSAIAQSRHDLGSPSDSDANFFRNNGKQDIALQAQTSSEPAKPESKSSQEIRQPPALKNPSSTPTQKPEVAPSASRKPGAIVVPTITTPIQIPVPTSGDRAPSPAPTQTSESPSAPIPVFSPGKKEPKSTLPSPQPTSKPVPQADSASPETTAQAFPKPSALSHSSPPREASRPIQVMQLESPRRDIPSPDVAAPMAEASLATVQISAEPRAKSPRPFIPPADEIPAPPTFAPRPPAVSQPTLPVATPRKLPQTSTNGFPIPAAIQPSPIRPVMPAPRPVPIAPIQAPISQPLLAPVATPRSIVIPVPPPESDRPQPIPVRTPKPAGSPLTLPPLATNPGSVKSGNLLPVPGPNIPVGNVGDMPSVYSARGNRPIPGVPITPANAGSVVVKYRVVVVAVDDTQQEHVRSMIPDAFPVVYRGQRVLQAGAFGDRSKADQLVASLSTQGIQAIIEPLK